MIKNANTLLLWRQIWNNITDDKIDCKKQTSNQIKTVVSGKNMNGLAKAICCCLKIGTETKKYEQDRDNIIAEGCKKLSLK